MDLKKIYILTVIIVTVVIIFFRCDFSAKDTISVHIVHNPYKVSPLSSSLYWYMDRDGFIEIIIEWKWELWVEIKNTYTHNQGKIDYQILWLYPDFNNIVQVNFYNKKHDLILKKTFHIQTHELPDSIKVIPQVIINTLWNEYTWLYAFALSPVLFDQNGDIRWYLNDSNFWRIHTKLRNGNIIIWSLKDTIQYHGKTFYEVSMSWKIIKTYIISNMYHHEVIELENWNLLLSSSSQSFSHQLDPVYRDDTIIEIDRETWKIMDEIDMNDIIYWIRPESPESFSVINPWREWEKFEGTTWNWIHINSLFMDGDNILLSSRRLDMLIYFNKETKEINWVFWRQAWKYESTKNFALNLENDINDETYMYPLKQYSASLTKSWKLLVFDNGVWRNQILWKDWRDYSRFLEYNINKETKKIQLNFTSNDTNIFTPFWWNIFELDNGNKLIWYTDREWWEIKLIEVTSQWWEILLEIQDVWEKEYQFRAYKMLIY